MWTDNTDSLVIALGCKHFFNTLKIWLKVEVQGKNNLRLTNVNNFYPELRETLCKAHLAYQALTGCKYTASFVEIGKDPPLKLLQKAQLVLRELSALEKIDENTISTIQGYICKIYESKNISKVKFTNTYFWRDIKK